MPAYGKVTDAWGNQLAILLDRRVANYGVPGYGVDQAVLRFEGNVSDEAEWAVLTVYPNNFLRNLTHNIGFVILPGFHYHNLKPRFSLDEQGDLRLHEIPFRSEEELFAYAQDPIAFLQDDWILGVHDCRQVSRTTGSAALSCLPFVGNRTNADRVQTSQAGRVAAGLMK